MVLVAPHILFALLLLVIPFIIGSVKRDRR